MLEENISRVAFVVDHYLCKLWQKYWKMLQLTSLSNFMRLGGRFAENLFLRISLCGLSYDTR